VNRVRVLTRHSHEKGCARFDEPLYATPCQYFLPHAALWDTHRRLIMRGSGDVSDGRKRGEFPASVRRILATYFQKK
jgi:hypothetical protein